MWFLGHQKGCNTGKEVFHGATGILLVRWHRWKLSVSGLAFERHSDVVKKFFQIFEISCSFYFCNECFFICHSPLYFSLISMTMIVSLCVRTLEWVKSWFQTDAQWTTSAQAILSQALSFAPSVKKPVSFFVFLGGKL